VLGWSRATHLIETHFATGQCDHVLILNLEFNRSAAMGIASGQQGGEGCYQLRSLDELRWGVWTCTVGEAGTSTLLSAHEETNPWFFTFHNAADFYKYCGYTLSNHRDYDYVPNLLENSIGGSERFYAFAKEIGHSIFRYFMETLSKAEVRLLLGESKVVIPHSVSIAPYQKLFREFDADKKARYSVAEHGNTVSCGVPLALSKSIAVGEVKRGDRAMLTPSGSGPPTVSFRFSTDRGLGAERSRCMKANAEFDIILFGATGFTGQLVAEYFATHNRSDDQLR